jgi:hypothetical protein
VAEAEAQEVTDIVDVVQGHTESISAVCQEVKTLMQANDLTAEEWRCCLGAVELASKDTYKLKRTMLDEAIKASRERQE